MDEFLALALKIKDALANGDVKTAAEAADTLAYYLEQAMDASDAVLSAVNKANR